MNICIWVQEILNVSLQIFTGRNFVESAAFNMKIYTLVPQYLNVNLQIFTGKKFVESAAFNKKIYIFNEETDTVQPIPDI